MLFPQARREQRNVPGWVCLDPLQHIDQVGVGIHTLDPTRRQQTLDDPNVLRPEFRPAKVPVLLIMRSSA